MSRKARPKDSHFTSMTARTRSRPYRSASVLFVTWRIRRVVQSQWFVQVGCDGAHQIVAIQVSIHVGHLGNAHIECEV